MNTLSQIMGSENAVVGRRVGRRERNERKQSAWENRHKILRGCNWNAHKELAEITSDKIVALVGFCPALGPHNLQSAVKIAEAKLTWTIAPSATLEESAIVAVIGRKPTRSAAAAGRFVKIVGRNTIALYGPVAITLER